MRLFICFFLFSSLIFSQNSFSKEFSITTDNDLYTSITRDRYYTNGLFLTYRYLDKNTKKETIEKVISAFQLGHMIYTPIKPTLKLAALHDRPFAAYFFAEYGKNKFYKNQDIFTTKIQLGIIGPNSKGEEIQNFIHEMNNFPKAKGWQHQIQEAFALNLEIQYTKYIAKLSTTKLDVSSHSIARAGTIFTDFSTGIYTRFGFKKLQKLYNSTAFHSNLNTTKNNSHSESFIFLKPLISYVLYDATLQGSLFNTDSPVTYDVMPFKFSLEIGYRYNWKRFNYGYTFQYHTKKLKSIRVKNNNNYGSISIGYYFN
jgi:hypothetical protein